MRTITKEMIKNEIQGLSRFKIRTTKEAMERELSISNDDKEIKDLKLIISVLEDNLNIPTMVSYLEKCVARDGQIDNSLYESEEN